MHTIHVPVGDKERAALSTIQERYGLLHITEAVRASLRYLAYGEPPIEEEVPQTGDEPYVTVAEAAEILTNNTDHEVSRDYVRILAGKGLIEVNEEEGVGRAGKVNLYKRADLMKIHVKQHKPRVRNKKENEAMTEEYGNTYVSASGYVHILQSLREIERAKSLTQKGGSNGRYFFTSGSTLKKPRFCYHPESSQEGETIVNWVMTGEGEEPV